MLLDRRKIQEISKTKNEPKWLAEKRLAMFDVFSRTYADTFTYGIGIYNELKDLNLETREFDGSIQIECAELGVHSLYDALQHQSIGPRVAESLFVNERANANHPLHALTAAGFNHAFVMHVPSKLTNNQIELMISSQGEVLAYLLILVDEGADVRFVERLESNQYNGIIVDVVVGKRSKVRYHSLQHNTQGALIVSRNGRVMEDGYLEWLGIDAGSEVVVSSVVNELVEPRARAEIRGVYAGGDDQLYDLVQQNDHQANETVSDILTKGVLSDHAKTIYRGLVKVREGARGCEGYQRQDALLLSSDAEIDPIPDLEIANNDVQCSHGVTVSRLDKDKLFYLMSRGLTEKEASAQFVEGHVGALLDGLGDVGMKEDILSAIALK